VTKFESKYCRKGNSAVRLITNWTVGSIWRVELQRENSSRRTTKQVVVRGKTAGRGKSDSKAAEAGGEFRYTNKGGSTKFAIEGSVLLLNLIGSRKELEKKKN